MFWVDIGDEVVYPESMQNVLKHEKLTNILRNKKCHSFPHIPNTSVAEQSKETNNNTMSYISGELCLCFCFPSTTWRSIIIINTKVAVVSYQIAIWDNTTKQNVII